MQRPHAQFHSKYVSNQNGYRIFFFACLIAGILGVGFRLYFNPERVRGWIEAALRAQPSQLKLEFARSELRLSDGVWPQLAIYLQDVRVWPKETCRREPGLKVSEVQIPFRLLKLFAGEVSMGTVFGETLTVNTSALKSQCGLSSSGETVSAETSTTKTAATKSSAREPQAKESVALSWWTKEQLQTLQNLVAGLSFARVELLLEHGQKTLILERFDVRTNEEPETIRINTRLRLPPEMTFLETIPAFSVDAVLKATDLDIQINGQLNEGSIQGVTRILSTSEGPKVEASLSTNGVPIATLLPILQKLELGKLPLQPRFLWLSCKASIQGKVHRLFDDNAIVFEDCKIDGEAGNVSIVKAERKPNGQWFPLHFAIAKLDLRKALALFGKEGPSGVLTEFGFLEGALDWKQEKEAEFFGAVRGLKVFFSNRSVHGQQVVPSAKVQLSLKEKTLSGLVSDVELESGEFRGEVHYVSNLAQKSHQFRFNVTDLKLDPSIQKLMVAGRLDNLSIKGDLRLQEGSKAEWKGEFQARGLESPFMRLPLANFKSELKPEGVVLLANAASGEVNQESEFFGEAKMIFADHTFGEEWISARGLSAKMTISDIGLKWEKASAVLDNGRIRLLSTGEIDKEKKVLGWVGVDLSGVRKMNWMIRGHSERLSFSPASAEFRLGDPYK